MPPAAFFSLTARSTASFSAAPVAAAARVSVQSTPILIVSADAPIADPTINAEASKPARRKWLFSPVIVFPPLRGLSTLTLKTQISDLDRRPPLPNLPGRDSSPRLWDFSKDWTLYR